MYEKFKDSQVTWFAELSKGCRSNLFQLLDNMLWIHRLMPHLHTDSTATGMRLNSSKQPQAPVCAKPL
jgi:hypothetical protein